VCILPLDEILKIRSKSETYRALVRGVETAESAKDKARAEEKLAETPWVMWEDDMATKSAIKKHAKLLPIASGDALVAAADIDNRSDVSGNTIDMRAMVDPDAVRSVIGDGMSPPAIEHQPAETFDFPVHERREPVAVEQTQAARPPGREASGPAPGPDDEWKPSPAEQARIAALEQAEADGRDSPAPNPSPAPAARRARAAVRSME
jgi:recombination protein RecT